MYPKEENPKICGNKKIPKQFVYTKM